MGRAKARPALCIFYISGLPGAISPARASREQAPLRSRQAPGQTHTKRPGHRPMGDPPPADLWDSPTAATKRPTPLTMHLACTQRAQALRLAQSSRWPARECVHPGVTTPWWLPLWLAGRAQLEACVLACPGASSMSGTGAPGTYKGEFGAAEVSSNLGAELTAAPRRCPTTPHPLGTSITWAALYAPKLL